MCESKNNCPIGVGENCPTIDSGTMARSRHTPPTIHGQSKSVPVARKIKTAPVLASFDIGNAVIWVNKVLLQALSSSRQAKSLLSYEDVTSLAHEFAHVLEYRDIFDKFQAREERSAEMIKRRADLVAKLAEEEYIKRVLEREKAAEKLAQRIYVELLSHFNRSQGGTGFSGDVAEFLSEEKAKQWINGLRESYIKKARKDYKTLREKVTLHGSSEGIAQASANKKKTAQKLLPVTQIQDVLPTSQSPTLRKLLKQMVKYNIMIVVSLTQEDI